ncbi:MAG: FAD-dependent oxidoreductase, partial [Candidatus Aminicenantales bacterium]
MKKADVIVVGAGPSGLRTAARLAGAGLEVRVLEKKPRVGAGGRDGPGQGAVEPFAIDDAGERPRVLVDELGRERRDQPDAAELLDDRAPV